MGCVVEVWTLFSFIMDGTTLSYSVSLRCGEKQINCFKIILVIKSANTISDTRFKNFPHFLITKCLQSFLDDVCSVEKLQSDDLLVQTSL